MDPEDYAKLHRLQADQIAEALVGRPRSRSSRLPHPAGSGLGIGIALVLVISIGMVIAGLISSGVFAQKTTTMPSSSVATFVIRG